MLRLANIAKPILLAIAMIIPTAAIAADESHPARSIPLSSIAKEVAPGYYELDPAVAKGKHILLPPTGGRRWALCLGRHTADGGCNGIYFSNR